VKGKTIAGVTSRLYHRSFIAAEITSEFYHRTNMASQFYHRRFNIAHASILIPQLQNFYFVLTCALLNVYLH